MTKTESEILYHHFTCWSDTRKGKLEMCFSKDIAYKEGNNKNNERHKWFERVYYQMYVKQDRKANKKKRNSNRTLNLNDIMKKDRRIFQWL